MNLTNTKIHLLSTIFLCSITTSSTIIAMSDNMGKPAAQELKEGLSILGKEFKNAIQTGKVTIIVPPITANATFDIKELPITIRIDPATKSYLTCAGAAAFGAWILKSSLDAAQKPDYNPKITGASAIIGLLLMGGAYWWCPTSAPTPAK